jgi:hypothetical protein
MMALTNREWKYKQIVDFDQDAILFADEIRIVQL